MLLNSIVTTTWEEIWTFMLDKNTYFNLSKTCVVNPVSVKEKTM